MGMSLLRVIEDLAGGVVDGRRLKAVAPSGASSGFLPASLADVPLDFAALQKAGSMLGSGAIVAVAEGTCMVDVALNVARFFARESCGKCWPCRVGSEKIVHLLDGVTRGGGDRAAFGALDELQQTLLLTSICGLGQVVPSPIASVVRHFKAEVDAHVDEGRCPEGTCTMQPARLRAHG
jgi:NADH-quinone oxidoreductase subunit F